MCSLLLNDVCVHAHAPVDMFWRQPDSGAVEIWFARVLHICVFAYVCLCACEEADLYRVRLDVAHFQAVMG